MMWAGFSDILTVRILAIAVTKKRGAVKLVFPWFGLKYTVRFIGVHVNLL